MLSRARTATIGAATLAILATAAQLGSSTPAAAGTDTLAASPIQHVVIIYQENHTFDDMLGPVCQDRSTPCNGYVGPVTMADGTQAANIVQPAVVPIVKHDPPSQDDGIANRWDDIQGCTKAPYYCVSHVSLARIPNLASLADTFAVSDATFADGDTASFGAHLGLVAGTRDGFLGYNPVRSKTGHKPGPGWGCPSFLDALWSVNGKKRQYVPTCVPDQDGNGPYRSSPVSYHATVMERMEQAGLTWHTYQGDEQGTPVDTSWSFCPYFAWCYSNRFNTEYDSSTSDFLTAAHDGTMPNLSILIPMGSTSQHNGSAIGKGDNYIGQIMDALRRSPEWDSTAVFITYDDCGCFYDHVTPPAGLGLRNPMVIASPYAKPDYTDSTVAVQPYSMLAFVQHTFGLAPLSPGVTDAYDYANSFDFSQRPLQVPDMTRQHIPRWQRREVARLWPIAARNPD